ncbi:uncharacterized protein M6B38_204590 [Iris pallida]|uniref:Uncharacterized protein n=1 Tax=Iris pallida TaxID=29817 RepID=A0AAX6E806_IRIPA|nr:uncharacterized protein M6B38_204590 [Iris pallida]
MAAASLSCRLSCRLLPLLQNPNPNFNSFLLLHHRSLKTLHSPIPTPHPFFHHHHHHHHHFHLTLTRPFSTQTPANPNPNPNPTEIPTQNPNPNPTENPAQNPSPHFKHQEIEGPTVDRDASSLAEETRQVLDTLSRSLFRLSNTLALLGVAHLGLGAYVAYSASPPAEVTVQGLAAFAFPFTAAFLVRRGLVPIIFFRKMEELGRLQILTLALQVSKSLNVLVVRIGVVSVYCMLGISAAALITPWLR